MSGPPESTYDLIIKDDLESSQALSCLQIETLTCPAPSRWCQCSFFIGDGAGVGKGRTIAGLIFENWHHGRRKAFSSKNAFKGILTSLPKAGGGEFGKFYSLPALNDPRIVFWFNLLHLAKVFEGFFVVLCVLIALSLVMHLDAEKEMMSQCVALLGKFIAIHEPNIRYLGLDTRMLMVSDVQDIIKRHQSQIITSLKDPDISIQRRM
ncbi:unnamed protein product [Camellia sinensis]